MSYRPLLPPGLATVSGNFRTGSTLTVERLGAAQLGGYAATAEAVPASGALDPARSAESLASALIRYRDASSGLDASSEGARDVTVGSGGRIVQFEFDTPLVSPPRPDAPDLTRRTLVRVLLIAPPAGEEVRGVTTSSTGALVMWAGAKLGEWEGGVGTQLREAAATFVLSPSR